MERTGGRVEVVDSGPMPPSLERSLTNRVLRDTYRIREQIGAGSQGVVYAAEHLRLGRRFAIKFLRAELARSARAVARFRREVAVLASIDSPYVVDVVDCGELDGNAPYMVMELLEGRDLRGLLQRGALGVDHAVQIAIDACRGLSAIHARGFIHRDVKPANVFVVRDDSHRDSGKLLDLGVAKSLGVEPAHSETLLGTLRYMAPEQVVDSGSVTSACDVYSLGAVLYHCLTGRPPHAAEERNQLMFEIVNREIPTIVRSRSGISLALDRVLQAALAREPSLRPSARELAALLESALRSEYAPALPVDLTGSDTSVSLPAPRERQPRAKRLEFPNRGLAALALCFVGVAALGAHFVSVDAPRGRTVATRVLSAVPPAARSSPRPALNDSTTPEVVPRAPPMDRPRTSSSAARQSGRRLSVRKEVVPEVTRPLVFDDVNPYASE